MKRHSLLSSTIMTPTERRMGRFLRAPDHTAAAAGGDGGGPVNPDAPANNQTGNGGDSATNANSDGNNTGQSEALARFWQEPKPEGTGTGGNQSGTGTSESETKPSGDQNGSGDFGKQLAGRLDALSFGEMFTPEIAKQIGEGDLTGANESFNKGLKEATRQSIVLNAQVMQRYGEQILTRVEQMIEGSLGKRDDSATLEQHFPAAKDPAARPLIQSVFDQALKHTGGDRTKAVTLAKDMLKLVGKTASSDFGFETPPGSREDYFGQDGSKSLVEELLARN